MKNMYVVAVLSVVLASCGGGGDDSTSVSESSDRPTAPGVTESPGESDEGSPEAETPDPINPVGGDGNTGVEFDFGPDNGTQSSKYFNGYALISSTFESTRFPEDNISVSYTNNSAAGTIVISVLNVGMNTITLDSSGRLGSDGLSREYNYNGAVLVSSRIPNSSGEPDESFFYDENRLLVRHESEFEGTTTYQYRDDGIPISSSAGCTFTTNNNSEIVLIECSGVRTEIDYDSNGNPVAIREFDIDGNELNVSSYIYERVDGVMNLGLVGLLELDFFQIQL